MRAHPRRRIAVPAFMEGDDFVLDGVPFVVPPPRRLSGVAQARGRVWVSDPYVFATAYGINAALRTAFSVELLQIPDWVWTDRTKALRRSVQQVTFNTLSMGSAEAFYAKYVEAWGAPVRKAYDAALDVYGYASASSAHSNHRRAAA